MTTTHNICHGRSFLLGLCLAGGAALPLSGQDIDRLEPKSLPIQALPGKADPSAERIASDPQRDNVIIDSLKGLVLLQNPENLNPVGLSLNGVIAEGYQPQDLFVRLSRFIGEPVSLARLDEIVREIVLTYRQAHSPVVDAYVPNQDITSGTVQVVIVEGRVGQVRVEGNRWFKDDLILSEVDVLPDGAVRSDTVSRDIDWLNRNPFRHTDLVLTRGTAPGTTDVVLQTRDRFPLRAYAGYENTGTDETGEDRVQVGFNWGNAFNQGHLMDYQYTGSADHQKLQGHSLRYTMNLPWRDTMVLNASYSESQPEIAPFNLDATSYGLSGRYIRELRGSERHEQRLLGGVDYKFSDSNLEFADIPVFGKRTQILQFSAGYGATMLDRWGQISLGGQLVYSPGDMLKDNNAKAFNAVRSGADSEYSYLDLNLTRLTRLPQDLTWRSKLRYKFADDLLIGSEQIGLGGYYSIRGFDERELNGDVGLVWNNELLSPNFRFDSLFGVENLEAGLQLHAFWDYGFAEQKGAHRFHMSSVGGGLRLQVRDNFSLDFDYGWQITGKNIDEEIDAKGNVRATVSY